MRCRPVFRWRVGLIVGLLDQVLTEGTTIRLPEDHFPREHQFAGSMLTAMGVPVSLEVGRTLLRRTMDLQ